MDRGVVLGWEPDAVEPDRNVVRGGQLDQRQKSRDPMVRETGKIQPLEFVQRHGCDIRQVSHGRSPEPCVVLFEQDVTKPRTASEKIQELFHRAFQVALSGQTQHGEVAEAVVGPYCKVINPQNPQGGE